MYKTKKEHKYYRLVVCLMFVLSVCILSRCTDPVEGCLDITSSNFEVDADVDCCRKVDECCCDYPSMTLNLFYKLRAADSLVTIATNTNFRLGQWYPLENNVDSIRIDTFNLFISNLSPNSSVSNDSVNTLESISTRISSAQGGTIETSFEDNLAMIDCRQFRYVIGTYTSDLTYDNVSFNIGLPEDLALFEPDEILGGHPLENNYSILFDEMSDSYQSVKLVYDIKSPVEQRTIAHFAPLRATISNSFVTPVAIEKGVDLGILMRINVLDVFKGIIFDVPNEDMSLIINENLIGSISILE